MYVEYTLLIFAAIAFSIVVGVAIAAIFSMKDEVDTVYRYICRKRRETDIDEE